MKKQVLALLLLGLAPFILSCTTGIQNDTPLPGGTPQVTTPGPEGQGSQEDTPAPGGTATIETIAGSERRLERAIRQGEHLWQERDVRSYRIQVATISIWHYQVHDVTVQDGQVVTATARCEPAPTEMGKCEVEDFDPEEFTVPALFERARWLAGQDDGRWSKVQIDPSYGFPRMLSFDDPDIIDEEWGWGVRGFEVLETPQTDD